MPSAVSNARTRRVRIPSVLMRCGTSRALFFHRHDLPADREQWSPILLAAMGSADGDQRHISGCGGGSSTTSKVAVIAKSARPRIDVDYTFVQVPVGSGKVDFSGNCGNVASGVGAFAVDEGLVDAIAARRLSNSRVTVRVFNTNTERVIEETVEVDEDGAFQPEGDCRIGGFSGCGSRIDVRILEPAGSMTGQLFPTGLQTQQLYISHGASETSVQVTLIDAANPFIFVNRDSMPQPFRDWAPDSSEAMALVESIRQAGAVALRLASTTAEASLRRGTPKISLLSAPGEKSSADINVLAYSMGKPRPSLPLTGAVGLGSALSVPGTIASMLSRNGRTSEDASPRAAESDGCAIRKRVFVLNHPTGLIEVEMATRMEGDEKIHIKYGSVARTARRIFEGNVLANTAVLF